MHANAEDSSALRAESTWARVPAIAALVLISIAFASCVNTANNASMPAHSTSDSLPTGGIASVLLFNGSGTSPDDVAAVEAILNASNLSYSLVNSSQLNEMGESQIQRYRLLIVPGGDFVKMGDSLTTGATADVRNAVRSGLNYLGICGGGFLAGHFGGGYNSFNLTSGIQFTFYSGQGPGIRKFSHMIGREYTRAQCR